MSSTPPSSHHERTIARLARKIFLKTPPMPGVLEGGLIEWIICSQIEIACVDARDANWIGGFSWHLVQNGKRPVPRDP